MFKTECPNCHKDIFIKSRKCKYCGIKIIREEDFVKSQKEKDKGK